MLVLPGTKRHSKGKNERHTSYEASGGRLYHVGRQKLVQDGVSQLAHVASTETCTKDVGVVMTLPPTDILSARPAGIAG